MPLALLSLGLTVFHRTYRPLFVCHVLPSAVNGAPILPSWCAARHRYIPNGSQCAFLPPFLSYAPSLTLTPEWSSLSLTHSTARKLICLFCNSLLLQFVWPSYCAFCLFLQLVSYVRNCIFMRCLAAQAAPAKKQKTFLRETSLTLFTSDTFCSSHLFTPDIFHTTQLLQQIIFTLGTFFARNFVHQTTFTLDNFYTKKPFTLTNSTPGNFYTKKFEHKTTFAPLTTFTASYKNLLHQQFLHQTTSTPDALYTIFTPNACYTRHLTPVTPNLQSCSPYYKLLPHTTKHYSILTTRYYIILQLTTNYTVLQSSTPRTIPYENHSEPQCMLRISKVSEPTRKYFLHKNLL